MIRTASLLFAAYAATLLTACATPPKPDDTLGWHEVRLPGKDITRYDWSEKDGRLALAARSERSASMWRRHVERAPQTLGTVSFSWWVQDLVVGASVAEASREDAPARVLFAFAGDTSQLPARTRAMFDLAEALAGERPPYATLMYVWDTSAPVGSVIINPRSDRIRKIVVDSGPNKLRQWRDHQRDLAADFRLAFGEAPGALVSIALMTDTDNTRSSAKAWYGAVSIDASTKALQVHQVQTPDRDAVCYSQNPL
jgi:Protein of unknown function (DUF3047)